MTKKIEKVLFHTRNKHDIRMARCCMSCAYKVITEQNKLRFCMLDQLTHRRCHMCHDWQMNAQMQGAGTSGGRIKRREYLMYALAIRCEEQEEADAGEEIEPKSIEEIRKEFENLYGSIFLN